jgi:acyl carrier protein
MGLEELEARIIEMIADVADVGRETITLDDDLYSQVGMDSLGSVALVVEIQRELGVVIPEEVIPKLLTARSYVQFVEENGARSP